MKKRIPAMSSAALLLALICLLQGCVMIVEDNYSIDEINGDITCEFRSGFNSQYEEQCIDTDVEFDKEHFLSLFKELTSYDPLCVKRHLDECDLKISVENQPEELDEMLASEFNVKALFEDTSRSVAIYRHGGKLYLFVLCMGGASKPDEEGYYFMELSEDAAKYWSGIISEVESGK